MKPAKRKKTESSLNPITGFPNEHKLYRYPKQEEEEAQQTIDDEELGLDIDERRIAMIVERLRWKGARKIRGYRFKGTIPEPKHATDYLPWLKEL
ncbi:hypothetical protein BH09BAC1_BH09BAC1_19580 [soil metagenome]